MTGDRVLIGIELKFFSHAVLTVLLTTSLIGCGGAGDSSHSESTDSELDSKDPSLYTSVAAKTQKEVEPPAGALIYQPALEWGNGEKTYQGTGFLAKTSSGEVVGITAAHFVSFDGPRLNGIDWLSVHDDQIDASFDTLVGEIGEAVSELPDGFKVDASKDFLIFAGKDLPNHLPALELDTRMRLETWEPVWLPNKLRDGQGYELLEGELLHSERDFLWASFEPEFKLQSQSGTPVISRRNGKVIGVLVSGLSGEGSTEIFLTPASNIAAMIDTDQRRALREFESN